MEDTICAISTAPGIGGIGIVRMSGKDSIKIAKKIFVSLKSKDVFKVKSHTLNYGHIIDPINNEKIDEVLLSVMKAPHTYTTEDVVEINCHGGIVAVTKTLESCLRSGARLAEPGEFTKRAFLNGRIDLAQSEAVIDLITSKTDLGMEKAFEQLEGSISNRIREYKDKILSLLAHIEASIDFPEFDIEEITNELLKNKIEELIREIIILLEDSDKGKIIREGLSTVIVGKPNVGKSSLLNILLRENRAIVTEIPGTTRDIIEEYINLGGVPLKLVDTAGIRNTEDIVEKIGVQRTKEVIDKSDLVIFVLDNSEELTQNDLEIAKQIKDKKAIIVINKIDLKGKLDEDKVKEVLPKKEIIKVSIKDKISLDKIEKSIQEMFFKGHIDIKNQTLITNVRHKNLLEKTLESLKQSLDELNRGMPVDCVSIDLKNAFEYLGYITGETVSEEVIKEIFKQFCIGK